MDKIKKIIREILLKLKERNKKAIIALSLTIASVIILSAGVAAAVAIPRLTSEPAPEHSDSVPEPEELPTDSITETDETKKEPEKTDTESDESDSEDTSDESESDTSDTTTSASQGNQGTAPGNSGSSQTDISLNGSQGSGNSQGGAQGGSQGSSGGGSQGGSQGSSGGSQGGSTTSVTRVHTYPDALAGIGEDNSTSLPYMPMKQEGATSPNASYNTPMITPDKMTPGRLISGSAAYSTTLVGYDGFLFCGDTFEDYQGTSRYVDSLLNNITNKWVERSDWAKSVGKELYFVIVPNKNSVYKEYMPESYSSSSYRRIDQVVDTFSARGLNVIDVRQSLLAEKSAHPSRLLYYKTDTHWNNHGGFIAYQQIMNRIRQDFPNAVLHSSNEYQINYCETYMKDQAYYLGTYDATSEIGPVYTLKSGKTATGFSSQRKDPWGQFAFCYHWPSGYSDHLYWYRWTNNYNSGAPSLYMLRDSFSIALNGFLKDSFHTSTFNWSYNFNESEIVNSGADVIIVEIAEKHLKTALAS